MAHVKAFKANQEKFAFVKYGKNNKNSHPYGGSYHRRGFVPFKLFFLKFAK